MRRPALLATVAVAGLAAVSFLLLRPAEAGQPPDDYVAIGEQLFQLNCVSCHGTGGVGTAQGPTLIGTAQGPTLIGVGEAMADFQLQTGRMPLAEPEGQPPAKPPAFSDQEIQALVEYVGSLGEGPPIPQIHPDEGDLDEGGELFRSNCAACHGAAGTGGALSFGQYAPSLHGVEEVQVAEAVRVGPGEMPIFDEQVLDQKELDATLLYVRYLQDPADPGGFSLGRVGPVAEGYVIWLFGMGAMILLVRWITRGRRTADEESTVA